MKKGITPGHLFGLAAIIAAVALLMTVLQQRDSVATTQPTARPAKATETPFGSFDGRPVYERATVEDLVPEERDWELQIAIVVLDERTDFQIENAVIDLKIKTPSSEEILENQANGTLLSIKGGTVVLWKAEAEGYETETEWSGAKLAMRSEKILTITIRLKPLSPQAQA